jgi:hypothetical protein
MYTHRYENSAVKLREYEKIFIGSNQDEGFENPCLGFNSESTQQIFKADSVTYFHYPNTAEQIPLSSSGLIEVGAISGPCPYYSDKIWKKMADYKKYVNWGDASPEIRQTGVWLCAWLSGNEFDPTMPPIWKERWFNPGYVDLSGAYIATSPSSGIIVDLDASMTFDPGVLYKYYHIGNINTQQRVDNISLSGELRVLFDDWTTYTDTVFYKVSDMSGFSNNGIVEAYADNITSPKSVTPFEFPDDNTLNLSRDNQCVKVIFNDSFKLQDKLTVSTWAHVEDWNAIQGNHIVGNNFRGGWSIAYNNGFVTPVFALFDNRTGITLVGNTDRTILTTKQLPGTSIPVGLAADFNRYFWIIDNGDFENGKNLFKMDFTGDVISRVNFTNAVQMQDLAIDGNNNIWVLASGQISGFDTFSIPFSSSVGVTNANKIDVTRDNVVRTFNCDDVCIDEQSNAWMISGGSVFKESSLILSGVNATNVGCDSQNNIWVLGNTTQFLKLSTNGDMILSGSVSDTTELCARGLTFTNEFKDGQYVDYTWIAQASDSVVYKIDTNGIVGSVLDASKFDNYIPFINGDPTGYDWKRKFNYYRFNKQPQIQADVYFGTDTLFQERKTLSIPTTCLVPDGWHMFTFTFDSTDGKFNYYVDSILRESISVPSGSLVYFEYENPLMIGSNVGHVEALGDELKTTQLYFKGDVDDLRIYNSVLNISDIRRLYFLKYNIKDLVWNMPTGVQNYLEEIERFFKFKLPGQKAQYYNVKLVGLGVTDPEIRLTIEDIILKTVKKIAPAHAELLNIVWE